MTKHTSDDGTVIITQVCQCGGTMYPWRPPYNFFEPIYPHLRCVRCGEMVANPCPSCAAPMPDDTPNPRMNDEG